MLEAIAALSWTLHRYADLAIATSLLVLNAVIAFVQERRAEGVVDTLRRRLQVNARVLRDGQWQILPARDLVPDDVIRIRQGDVVPADIRLLTGTLSVDQSVLTGESQDAEKAADADGVLGVRDPSWRGDGRRHRHRRAHVLRTHHGARADCTTDTPRGGAGRRTSSAGCSSSWAPSCWSSSGSPSRVASRSVDVLPLLLALLLGAVPVALPVMLTVSMAVGARELSASGVLVTRLSATEDAAAMDVLCVDKTGTITANHLAVARVIPLPGFTEEDVLRHAAYASEAANQDPIDLAILAAARDARARRPARSRC